MKKIVLQAALLPLLIFHLILTACGPSKAELEAHAEHINDSIQATLDKGAHSQAAAQLQTVKITDNVKKVTIDSCQWLEITNQYFYNDGAYNVSRSDLLVALKKIQREIYKK